MYKKHLYKKSLNFYQFFERSNVRMKRFIALFTSVLISLSFCILPTYATESPSIQDISFKSTVSGQLICDDGTTIQLTGYRRDTPSTANFFPDTQVVSYDYIVPLSNKSHEDNVSGSDPTNYLTATLTLYYTEYDVEPTEYMLTRVSGTWADPDPNDGTYVSKTADIFAICYGIGTNNIWRKQTKEGSITSGSYLNTGFQYSIQSYYGAMGATMSLDISQGATRHWTLELECYPIEPST